MFAMVVFITTMALIRIYEFDWEKALKDDADVPVIYDSKGNPVPLQQFKLR